MTKPAYSYRRVSKPEKDSGTISLDWQEETIARYCKAQGIDLVQGFVDDGVSAGKPLGERKDGAQLLQLVQGRPCIVVCAKLDRMFRSSLDFAQTVAAWQKADVDLVCVSEGFDLGSIWGKFMATVLAGVAELERGLIGDRIRAGVKTRRERGQRVARHARYGFRFEPSGEANRQGKPILVEVRDDQEQATIGIMKALHGRGKSLREIADELTRRGIRSRVGGPWGHTTVRGILLQARGRKSAGQVGPAGDGEASVTEAGT